MTIQALASKTASVFASRYHNDGTSSIYRKSHAYYWVFKLCYVVYGEKFPNDYKYKMLFNVLNAIAESNPGTEVAEIDLSNVIDSSLPTLCSWAANGRRHYIEEILQENSHDINPYALLSYAQYKEYNEILHIIWTALEKQLQKGTIK